ncbi:MAG: ATPase [Lentisphaerae bacterium]|nr:ATPase [Lentisphaerota bacterium]
MSDTKLTIAIPLANGQLCQHFGHCQQFALIVANPANGEIISSNNLTPPPHEPGVLPRWLAEQNATLIIAGGMGQRAQDLFTEQGIKVVVGAPVGAPAELVKAYLSNTLKTGTNSCAH